MSVEVISELVSEGLKAIELEISQEQLAELVSLAEQFIEHGRERSVTALAEAEDVVRELVVDSLACSKSLEASSVVMDLGSGGGIPGLPLAVVRPDCRFILVESNGKKVAWINEQVARMGLEDRVSVLCMRAEDVARQSEYRGKCDVVVAKALSSLSALIELGVPLLNENGRLMAYKGVAVAEEIEHSGRALQALGAGLGSNIEYELGERQRCIVVVRKVKPTSERYPRRVGLPQHKPL